MESSASHQWKMCKRTLFEGHSIAQSEIGYGVWESDRGEKTQEERARHVKEVGTPKKMS